MVSNIPAHGAIRMRLHRAVVTVSLLPISCPTLLSHSVFSHEAPIDAVWDGNLKPLLMKRFPDASEDQLQQAHGFAYGGAIIQDFIDWAKVSQQLQELRAAHPPD